MGYDRKAIKVCFFIVYTQKGKSKGQLNALGEFLVSYILIELRCLFVCMYVPTVPLLLLNGTKF